MKNQGNVAAGAFKVSVEYSVAGGTSHMVAFKVPGQADMWKPQIAGLNAGASVTLTGKLLFQSSAAGKTASIGAIADSCADDEFIRLAAATPRQLPSASRALPRLSRNCRNCLGSLGILPPAGLE